MIDLNLEPGDPTIDNDIEVLLQQVNILFETTPGDLYGDIEYGTDYSYYLYELKYSAEQLRNQIMDDLREIDKLGFAIDVDVKLIHGTEDDIALVQIVFFKNSRTYTQNYKITQ